MLKWSFNFLYSFTKSAYITLIKKLISSFKKFRKPLILNLRKILIVL